MSAPNVTHARVRAERLGEVHLVLFTAANRTLCGKRQALPCVGPDMPTCDKCLLEYRRLAGPGPGAKLYALTDDEVGLLREALDSHVYWQLSDEVYRDSGFVSDPGSDEPDKADEIKAANALDRKLAGEVGDDG